MIRYYFVTAVTFVLLLSGASSVVGAPISTASLPQAAIQQTKPLASNVAAIVDGHSITMGYYVIQAISTGDKHPSSENSLYADAKAQYTLRQEDMHGADVINSLKAKAHIVDNLPEH